MRLLFLVAWLGQVDAGAVVLTQEDEEVVRLLHLLEDLDEVRELEVLDLDTQE